MTKLFFSFVTNYIIGNYFFFPSSYVSIDIEIRSVHVVITTIKVLWEIKVIIVSDVDIVYTVHSYFGNEYFVN